MGPFDYLIVGGGISGLTSAYYLSRLLPKKRIGIIEKSSRFGGQIVTEMKDGIEFEMGPRFFSSRGITGEALVDLVVHLGLKDQISMMPKSSSGRRYIYLDSKLYLVPTTIGQFISSDLPFKFELLKAIKNDLLYKQSHPCDDESVESFLSKRFGKDLTEKFFSAFIRTITGSGLDVSMKANFPVIWDGSGGGCRSMLIPIIRNDYPKIKLRELVGELVHGNKDKGFADTMKREGGLYRFKYSIHFLTDALGNYLNRSDNVKIYKNSRVTKMKPAGNSEGTIMVGFRDERSKSVTNVQAKRIVVACSAADLAKIISSSFGGKSSSITNALNEIKYNRITTVNLAYKNLGISLDSFGYATPISEKTPVYGTMYRDYISKGENISIFTSICGTSEIEELLGNSSNILDSVIDLISREVTKHLNLDNSVKPTAAKLHRYESVFPRYSYGHTELIRWITKRIEHYYGDKISLLGWCYNGLGLGPCVMHARNLAIDQYNIEEAQAVVDNFCRVFSTQHSESLITPKPKSRSKTSRASAKESSSDGSTGGSEVAAPKKGASTRSKKRISKKDFIYNPPQSGEDDYLNGDDDYNTTNAISGIADTDNYDDDRCVTSRESGSIITNTDEAPSDGGDTGAIDSENVSGSRASHIHETIQRSWTASDGTSISDRLKDEVINRRILDDDEDEVAEDNSK